MAASCFSTDFSFLPLLVLIACVYYNYGIFLITNKNTQRFCFNRHVCRFCGATGDSAHTDNYCSKNPERGQGASKKLLNTTFLSSGRKRN